MSNNSGIEGADVTWAPVILHPERLEQPFKWKNPRRISVNSMSDLFHPDVPREFILDVWRIMRYSPQHTFQILTKRPERMMEIVPYIAWYAATREEELNGASGYLPYLDPNGGAKPLPNVWLGVSVENQYWADIRIPLLLQTPAAVRFVSGEPMLKAVDLSAYMPKFGEVCYDGAVCHHQCSTLCYRKATCVSLTTPETFVDWVIVGGESGPKARPMNPEWVRSVRDQCQDAGVPFFFKQWGEWFPRTQWEGNPELVLPDDDGPLELLERNPRIHVFRDGRDVEIMHRVGKKAAGAMLDGREWREFPCS